MDMQGAAVRYVGVSNKVAGVESLAWKHPWLRRGYVT
jgi:hypothetical protein